MLLDNIRLFLLIVEKGSLAGAAREAGLSATTVSERLAALEAHFGTILLNRTTRAISLTEEGRLLVEQAPNVLDEVDELENRIRFGAEHLSGMIRLSVPSDLGRHVISEALDEFIRDNPDISVELHLSDGYVDIVGQGMDLAVRFGTLLDSTLRVRRLKPTRRVICASPDYIARHGEPLQPSDLKRHNCLLMRFGNTLDNLWELGDGTAKQVVTVSGNRVANDGAIVRQWALAGHGIVWKADLDVAEDIRQGRLVELLRDFAAPPAPLQLLFPPGRTQPRRVRMLADHLAAALDKTRLSGV